MQSWQTVREFFRLLPLTVFVCFLVLTVQIGHIAKDLHIFKFNQAHAEEKSKKEKKKDPEQQPSDKPSSSEKLSQKKADMDFNALLNFSEEEARIISDLSKRRHKLDQRERELETRMQVLQTLETRVNKRMESLAQKEEVIKKGVGEKEAKNKKRIQELIKVYQAMEPADAARILQTLELEITLAVLGNMSAIKSAPIFAAMPPDKAKQITERLFNE